MASQNDVSVARAISRNLEVFNRVVGLSYPIVAISVVAALGLGSIEPWYSVFPCAFLFGWFQVGGRCGASHFMTFAFFWRRSPNLWWNSVLLYTFSGLVSSALVGAIVGYVGSWILRLGSHWHTEVLIFLGIVLTFREFGWLRVKLPQRDCQTNRNWARTFGFRQASAMWGFHIGLAFATVITYGGFWFLVASILLVLDGPLLGVGVMVVYWFGRCIPLWLAPTISDYSMLAPEEGALLHRLQGLALALVTFAVAVTKLS